jgi:hypothetical protein
LLIGSHQVLVFSHPFIIGGKARDENAAIAAIAALLHKYFLADFAAKPPSPNPFPKALGKGNEMP